MARASTGLTLSVRCVCSDESNFIPDLYPDKNGKSKRMTNDLRSDVTVLHLLPRMLPEFNSRASKSSLL